ncbi:MAG: hypothetical protein AMXMBFR23_20480 [Chloroflexota bacterium]
MGAVSLRETFIALGVLLLAAVVTIAVLARDGGPPTVWRADLGAPVSAGPLLAAGALYAGTEAGNLLALDPVTGAVRWRAPVGSPPRGALRTDGSRVIARTDAGGVVAVSLDGAVLWEADGLRANAAPLVVDGLMAVTTRDRTVVALTLGDGVEVWRTDVGSSLEAGLAAVGGLIAAGDLGGRLHLIDPATGTLRETRALGTTFAGPVLDAGGTLIAAPDPHVVAIAPDGVEAWRTVTGEPSREPIVVAGDVVVVDASPDLVALDRTTGTIRWRYTSEALVVTFGVGDGLVVAGMHTGEVHGIDLASGERRWRYRTNEPVRGAPTVDEAAGITYFGGRDGFVYAIETAQLSPE